MKMGKLLTPYKWEVGTLISTPNSRLCLLEQIRILQHNSYKKGYKYECMKCHHIDQRLEYDFEKHDCPVCTGKKIKEDINSIAVLRPELIHLFRNERDAYTHGIGSHSKVDFICPTCKTILKDKIIKNVIKTRLFCPICSPKSSMGERIMASLLKLANIDFNFHETFDWSENKQYDFYFKDTKSIVEMHGEQHYLDGCDFSSIKGNSSKEEQENDYIKRYNAKQNGIINYIEINCSKSNFAYIINNILQSEIATLYPKIKEVDLIECEKLSSHSMVEQCAKMWNEKYTVTEIIEELPYKSSAINNWLHQAQKIGLCTDYNKENSDRRRGKKVIKLSTLECYWSVQDASDYNDIAITKMYYIVGKGTEYMSFDKYCEENNIEDKLKFFRQHLVE